MILPYPPVSTNTIYKFVCNGRYPRMYMEEYGHQLKQFYQIEAKNQWCHKIIKDDVEVKIKLYFKDKRRRDIDNYNKLLLDSLTGICWQDDKQIRKMEIEKFIDKVNPRIEIEVNKYGREC